MAEKNEAHDHIKARLAQIGVTHEDDVKAATDAHDDGVDVAKLLADVAAGLPQWLALLKAIRAKRHAPQAKPAGAGAGRKAKDE